MKKLLCTAALLFGSVLHADPVFTKGAEGKIKYQHSNNSNKLQLEIAGHGRLENDFAWGDAKIKFNVCDVESWETFGDLTLERFLIGYKFYRNGFDCESFLELGRAKMDSLFSSKLQFNSYFNGMHASFSKGNFRIHAGENIVDSKLNHYGLVGEATYENIGGLPLALGYSFTNWISDKDYIISEIKGSYQLGIVMDNLITLYFGALRNHNIKHQASGVYGGVTLGVVEKAKDWMVDVNYQYCEEDAIPDFDYNGIGNGVQVKGAFGVTDHLSLQSKVALSDAIRVELGANYKW